MDWYAYFHSLPSFFHGPILSPLPHSQFLQSYRRSLRRKILTDVLSAGTNDLGANAFLTSSQVPGKTLPDYTSCVFYALDDLYNLGARNFVLFNLAPLELAPLYANETYGGVDESWLWVGKHETFIGSNKTATSEIMTEYTRTVNDIYEYGVGFEAVVKKRWKGAELAVFDVHNLVGSAHSIRPFALRIVKEPLAIPRIEIFLRPSNVFPPETEGWNSYFWSTHCPAYRILTNWFCQIPDNFLNLIPCYIT